MESFLVADANDADEEDPFKLMDLFDDDFSDEDSEGSVKEELRIIFLKRQSKMKNFRWNEERLNWDEYAIKLTHRDEFHQLSG